MNTMEADIDIVDPPEVSRLSMVRQISLQRPSCGIISSTDRALVLLYAGIPVSTGYGYLVYDASTNSISRVPMLDSGRSLCRAAILSLGKGEYVLAEVVSRFDDATLYLWYYTSYQSRWRSLACLPPRLFPPKYSFKIDMAFSYADTSVCFVDLLKGVLVCKLHNSPEPEITFVPLPVGYSIDFPSEVPREGYPMGRPRPEEFRTMRCVGGAIKFVSLVGYYERHSHSGMVLKTWNLSQDLKNWELGKSLSVTDIWASQSFCERNLPRVTPTFPVLSLDDAEAIYVTLNVIDYEKYVNNYGEICPGNMLHKAHYMICIDTVQNKILSSNKIIPENWKPYFPDLIPSNFNAYLQEVLLSLIA
nr:unnamed protein product [Digitaria exilis]